MTLDADCTTDATILVLDGYTLDGAGNTITAVDPPAGHFVGGVVENAGAVAHVMNLTVTASGLADVCDAGDDRLRGIMFDGASGSIMNNTVTGINQGFSGCQEGNGIEVRNAPFDGTHPNTQKVVISGNSVLDYQKNGITANGDVSARIVGNTVTGLGPVIFIAQNGIQFGFGGTGQARDNVINGSWYTGASWSASGLLIFEASGVTAQGNTINASQIGVGIETWCWLAPQANGNHVVGNTINGSDYGVSVAAYDFAGLSTCDPVADNNKIVNNVLSSPGLEGVEGIFVGAADVGGGAGHTPSAGNSKVINNKISGFTTAIVTSGDAETKVHANAAE